MWNMASTYHVLAWDRRDHWASVAKEMSFHVYSEPQRSRLRNSSAICSSWVLKVEILGVSWAFLTSVVVRYTAWCPRQPRWLSGLTRSSVHSQ